MKSDLWSRGPNQIAKAGARRPTAGSRVLGFHGLAIVLGLIAGCGGSSSSTTPPPPPPPPFQISGKVLGGQQPVTGAQVSLYTAGSSGYGSGATLLASVVFTNQNGVFTIDGSSACPSDAVPVYLLVSGGDPGVGAQNPAIEMMAALGECGNLASLPTITVDEVTTVAAVWALAPFLKASGSVGASSGNAQGLLNAFANIGNLADPAAGTAPGKTVPAGAKVPASKINALANILAACVSSSGSGVCNTLFAAATPPGGSTPNNTLQAALNIAANPASNVSALFSLSTMAPAFQPALGTAPPDWLLAVNYTGGGLNTPGALALDSSGNVWTANYFGSVTELSSIGQPISPAAGFTGGSLNESYGLTVNADESVWVTDEQTPSGINNADGNMTVLNSKGQVISGADGFSGGGIYFPVSAAADTDGSVWVVDYGNSTASRFSSSGSPISGTGGFGDSQLQGPVAVAIDAGHNAWFVNQAAASGSVTSISPDGSQVNTTICGGEAPSGIAIDSIGVAANVSRGHVWTANYYTSSVSELALNSDGTVTVVSTGYTGGGLDQPNGIAIDGAGNVWATDFRGSSITELQGANSSQPGAPISSSNGFGRDASLSAPFAAAIDASGNVWVSNQGSSTITQFVGAATPVKTPLLGPPQLP